MKKMLLLFAVTAALLLALTGCSGRNRNDTIEPESNYPDSAYTADEDGMANEEGQDGAYDGRYDDADRPGSVADGMQDAVDEAGNAVDDIADGAADAVDDATDAVRDAAGAVTGGDDRVRRPSSAA